VIYGGGGGGGALPGFSLYAGGGRGGLGGGGGGAGGADGYGGGATANAYYSTNGTYINTPLGSYGPGAVNSGGGGGGGSHGRTQYYLSAPPSVDGGRWLGGAGGSGIVVLRHPVASRIGTITGGGNVLYDGSTNVVYVFTSSGTITWS
jgi:hypothetical protein